MTLSRKVFPTSKSSRRMRKSNRSSWSSTKPSYHERTVMKQKCGSKCFLGPNKSFPICKRNTCTISPKGVEAAYKRARQWHHQSIANKARRIFSGKCRTKKYIKN